MVDSRLTVDPYQLENGGAALLNLSRRAERIRNNAREADTAGRQPWGRLGDTMGLPSAYQRMAAAIVDHLTATAASLDAHSDRLRTAAARYRRLDDATADRFRGYPEHHRPGGAPDGPRYGEPLGADDTEPSRPVAGAGGIAADVRALGPPLSATGDPFGWLAGSPFGFLREFTAPLAEVHGLLRVTGAPLGEHPATWRRAAVDLGELAGDLGRACDAHLTGWRGDAGDRARYRLGCLARDARRTADRLDDLATVLTAGTRLVGTAHGLINDRVVELFGELVDDWAAATEVPGADVAAAAESVRKTAEATLDCVGHARRAEAILGRIGRFFTAVTDATAADTARYQRMSASGHP